jgi:hypothetical protein
MKLFTNLLFLVIALFFCGQLSAQCSGIEIVGYKSDNPDSIKLRTTEFIPGNTRFYLTDNIWNGTTFGSGEGTFSFDTPSGGIPAGTIGILTGTGLVTSFSSSFGTIVSNNSISLATIGDEIYVTSVNPSGTVAASNICFAVIFGVNPFAPIPEGRGINVGDFDNAVYNGTGSVTDAANWTGSNTPGLVPLPVQLKTFNVKLTRANTVELNWATATEQNNKLFEIERSADGMLFEKIGDIAGADNSQLERRYTYTDVQPLKGMSYYRLRQVDFDGRSSYSPVRTTNIGKNAVITMAPSPATDIITISTESPAQDDAAWQVFDVSGRLVLAGIWPAEALSLDMEVHSLPEGAYTFRLVNRQNLMVKQFYKR